MIDVNFYAKNIMQPAYVALEAARRAGLPVNEERAKRQQIESKGNAAITIQKNRETGLINIHILSTSPMLLQRNSRCAGRQYHRRYRRRGGGGGGQP